MSASLKPPATAYTPLERAVLRFANAKTDANARDVAAELDKADDATVAIAARYLFRNRLLGPREIAESAALAVARGRRA